MSEPDESRAAPHEPGSADREARIEELVAQALERHEVGDVEAVQRLLEDAGELAPAVRERLQRLAALGLLASAPERLPERFGRYRILAKLGEGGMSVVYLARDETLERDVALKVSRAPIAGGERARERFRREVRAASLARHPCLVPIHDAGEAEGRAWFAMEHVEGATLADVIERLRASGIAPAALSAADLIDAVRDVLGVRDAPASEHGEDVERAGAGESDAAAERDPDRRVAGGAWGKSYVESVCRIVADVADALAALHAAGIVHRDVKPSNVLLRPDGRALLFDLGLAHLDEMPALTRTGEFAGTPSYVAPEQLLHGASRADPRSDVYSLGVTLYELLTLRRPFEGKSAVELWRAVVRDEPPLPRRFHPALAPDLETVCLAALEKDPRRRYASAPALAADLRSILEYRGVGARPVSALTRGFRVLRRDPSLALALALAAAIFVALPVGLFVHGRRVARQRDLAELKAAETREVLAFVIDIFRHAEGSGGEAAPVARAFLDRAAERLALEFGDKLELRAALMRALGELYASLGEHDLALPLLDRALAVAERAEERATPEVASALAELAGVHLEVGNAGPALALAERALRAFDELESGASAEAVLCRAGAGQAALALGELARAEEHLARALADLGARGAEGGELEARVRRGLAGVAHARGDDERAAAELESARSLLGAQWSPRPALLADVLADLEVVRRARGEHDAAEAAAEDARALRAPLAGALPDLARLFRFEPPWREPFARRFQEGITALQAREHERAVAAFADCLELNPRASVCAYNLACAESLAGRTDDALRWLARARELGFAHGPSRVEAIESDPDLAALRGTSGFTAEVERMRAERDRSLARPALYVPASIAADAPIPLLVVLHRDGSSGADAVAREWRDVADRLGCALLAPSARRPADAEGTARVWFDAPVDLARERWEYEPAVLADVRGFQAEHALDPSRVWIAGEGMGGLVALDLAVRAPGLFRAVLLCDAPLPPAIDERRARLAATLGSRIGYVARTGAGVPLLVESARAADIEAALEAWLDPLGFAPCARVAVEDAPWASAAERASVLAAVLEQLTTRP